MPLVSSVYGMHSILRQCHQNSLGYGGGKNINIFKGKVLHPVAKVMSVQAAESPGRSQKVLTTPRPLPNSVLGGCAAAQQLPFYNSLSLYQWDSPNPTEVLIHWFIFPLKRDNVFDNLFMVTAREDNDTQNTPKLNIIILPLWLCYF